MNRPKHFYYITHKDNLKSILKKGILSRSQTKENLWTKIFKQGIKSIHSEDVVQRRKDTQFRGRSLWDYANVYFQARNSMLFSVKEKFGKENIIVLQINSDILNIPSAGITDGNAASQSTNFFEDIDRGLSVLNQNQFDKQYWSDKDDSKRTIMAEALVPDQIPKEKILGIFTANQIVADQIRKDQDVGGLNIIPNAYLFFLPEYQNKISENIVLKKGDMFFSKMQTYTISVNTVGIMGKGLASRAKYQFPDVYVLYQDLCKQKKLKMGIPYLYKRSENFISSLMEEEFSSVTKNGHRWFLLFPTKNHWREKSPMEGIERGLKWLVENYKELDISSIALPALGCGLGGLDWKDVGPLMCGYLSQTDLQSSIYLPLERPIPPEQLKPEFLLKANK